MQQVHKTQAFTTSSSGWSSWRGVKRPLKRYATASTETFTQPIGLSQRNSGAICSCCSASASNVHSTPDESGSYLEADTLHGNQPHNSGGGNQQATAVSPSLTQRVKNFFGGGKFDRKRLQALGMGAVASYGFVSNATYGTGLAISWIAFVRQTGKSPLMAQQWKPFLALYSGFWAAQHLIRPLRFSLALAMSPVFDKFINFVQEKTQFKRQNAFAVYLFLLGSVSSIGIFGSIRLFAGPIAFAVG